MSYKNTTDSNNLKIALGDKVKVKLKDNKKNKKNLNIGTVLFYGYVESHQGTWFGVSFDSSIGKNDGTYKKRKYFASKPRHGCFVHHEQIIKIVSKSKNKQNIRIPYNSTISLPDYGDGIVKFAGLAAFNPGIWYGIELTSTSKQNKGNGTVSGIKYFQCSSGNAIFRRQEDLYAELEDHDMLIDTKKNIKPSIYSPNYARHSNDSKKYKSKKWPNPKFSKCTSAPYGANADKSVPLIDLSYQISHTSNSEDAEYIYEIKDNDHSNETKEEEYDFYDEDIKPKLSMIDASDEIYADDEEEEQNGVHKKMQKRRDNLKKKDEKRKGNKALTIVESDTSDLDDSVVLFAGAALEEEEDTSNDKQTIQPISTQNKPIKSKYKSKPSKQSTSAPTLPLSRTSVTKLFGISTTMNASNTIPNIGAAQSPYNIYSKRSLNNLFDETNDSEGYPLTNTDITSTYLAHLHEKKHAKGRQKSKKSRGHSHATYLPKKRSSSLINLSEVEQNAMNDIKKLQINLYRATSPDTHQRNLNTAYKMHGTPVSIGQLSLDFSSDDIHEVTPPTPINISQSKSMPSKHHQPSPITVDASKSATSSPIGERDRALTFPTMALNTDNASKISAATPNQQTFKVLIIGQSRVGKSAIIKRFVKDKFSSSYKMTLGAAQHNFKCEVPIDLIEEVPEDANLVRSMTSFLEEVNEENNFNQTSPQKPMGGLVNITSTDPFEEDDAMAEFGDDLNNNTFDYGSPNDMDYRLSNMDNDAINIFQNPGTGHQHHGSKSITDYGQFTIPQVDTTQKDVRKVSMKLQITLDIVDVGFHATDEDLFDDVNAMILVMDYTKASSMQDAVDKYEHIIKNSMFKRKRKKKRPRASSSGGSNLLPDDDQREYIPLIVAVNKCDKKKQFKKKDIKKIIGKKLEPVINQYFPEYDEEDVMHSKIDETKQVTFSDIDDGKSANQKKTKRKQRNFTNATLLQPPNLSFIYNDDNKGSDSETDLSDDSDEDQKGDEKVRKRKKIKKSSSDLLTVAAIYSKNRHSDSDDPFNTPLPADRNKAKRRKKSSKKIIKRDKSDIRYIDIISCSAKSGKNIEKLFGTCIKKTIPSKLTKDVTHKRTKTTAHVTAPIWLRQVVAEFQKDANKANHHTTQHSEVDDNFRFLGDDDQSD